jgi:peroxiredoxin
MLRAYLPLLLIFLLALTACGYSPVKEDTVSADRSYSDFTGVKAQVGQPAPDFTLNDGAGNPIALSSYQGQQAALVLFYRGDWCPYCIGQLEDYQSLLPLLQKYDIQLLAISPDDQATTQNTQRKFGQDYLFLSDKDLSVTRNYGIRSAENLPHPALFLVDKEGVLRWYYTSQDYKTRPSPEQVERVL